MTGLNNLTASDWIAIASMIVSFLAMIFSWLASSKANNTQDGMIELEIRQAIENSKSKIGDITVMMGPLKIKRNNGSITEDDNELLKIYEKNFDSAIQSMLNTYESACGKYLDSKIDKVRFKKTYQVEIRNLIDNKDLKDYFGINSRYQPIIKVYENWENHERV